MLKEEDRCVVVLDDVLEKKHEANGAVAKKIVRASSVSANYTNSCVERSGKGEMSENSFKIAKMSAGKNLGSE